MRRIESLLELIYYQIKRLGTSILSIDESSLDVSNRLTALENIIYEVTYREVIDPTGTTTGSITFPAQATLDTEDYPGNAVLSTITDTNQIEGKTPVFNNEYVTATLGTNGDWATSNFTASPVALIFRLKIRANHYSSLDPSKIIDAIFPIPDNITGLKWVELNTSWTGEPTEVPYSGSDGNVFEYTYGSTTYYRFVPNPYDSELDSFYASYSDPDLIVLITTRGRLI